MSIYIHVGIIREEKFLPGAKEDEIYVMLPPVDGEPGWGMGGVYFQDTLYFSEWRWDIDAAQRLSSVVTGPLIQEYYALPQEDRSQAVGLQRELRVMTDHLQERWHLTNVTSEAREVTLKLVATPKMIDLFATRIVSDEEQTIAIIDVSPNARMYRRVAKDGVVHSGTLSCDGNLPTDLSWTISLAPRATQTLNVYLSISSSNQMDAAFVTLPSYADWRQSFATIAHQPAAVTQAIDDIRMLLLRTENGPYPAAGMPIFVNFFGRDALITGMMILEWRPDVLRSVLTFLATRQGKVVDSFREEEPGKILHEVRRGELSRTDRIPFGRYYGSIDSTPLFLMAADAYLTTYNDPSFASDLLPAVEAATDWLVSHLNGPSGLATFEASGSGLTVQSWKDSANSMVDEHGQPARQPLAVAEVQGYAYAALIAAARLIPDRADSLTMRALSLRNAFHAKFWLPELGTYAMALDADMAPLRVLSSDPGHLLWTSIVPDDIAPVLVKTMMSKALWSGWGLRTLGANEVAYNPVSYHNGSVWPHDTGLFAMGLARYGFTTELRVVAQALLDLAEASPRRQMPELISGFERSDHPEPVPYTHANAPQSWAAAAVVRMAYYLSEPA